MPFTESRLIDEAALCLKMPASGKFAVCLATDNRRPVTYMTCLKLVFLWRPSIFSL